MELDSQVTNLPHAAGVYLFRDAHGNILYVGKAKDLHKRVRSYFQGRGKDTKTSRMLARVREIDHYATATEKEALILEDTLIKEHHPRYNVQLRDDKRYPYLKLSIQESYPRLSIVRRTKKDGALYFGPFPSAASVHETLRAIQRVFPLRRCSSSQFANRTRPCLNFQLKRCLAPCCQHIDYADYRQLVAQVRLFLEGKSDSLLEALEAHMRDEARQLHFENAARLRDRLAALHRILEKQTIVSQESEHRDVLAIEHLGRQTGIQVLFIRGGRLLGGKFFAMKETGLPDEETLSTFLYQFYKNGTFVPREILVSAPVANRHVLEEVLGERRGARVRIKSPRRNHKGYRLVQMAQDNAEQKLQGRSPQIDILEELQGRFGLANLPQRIEGFDISTLGGRFAVGSMVVFHDGQPLRSAYRRYRIRSTTGVDDYAMTYEVLLRRLHRGRQQGDLPNLLLVDGGKGQLHVAMEALADCHIQGVDVLSLAKKSRPDKEERVFLPNRKDPIILKEHSASSLLLQHVRDEAHRFAIAYHTRLRDSGELRSALDSIPGIGLTRKRNLLRHLGGIQKIMKASVAQLTQVPGMSDTLAKRVWDHFHTPPLAREGTPETTPNGRTT
jgi:excinuclease ABC subunit C